MRRAPRSKVLPAPAAPVIKPTNGNSADIYSIIQPKVRDRWMGLTRRSYTPSDVKSTLEGTNSSRIYGLHGLFEMMEDTWPRLAKNLHEVRSSVSRLEWEVKPFCIKGEKPTASAQEKAKFVEEMFWGMDSDPLINRAGVVDTIYDLMDAYAKGIAVLEIDWGRSDGGTYKPLGTRWVRSIYYDYPLTSPDQAERLMLDPSGQGNNQQEFPQHKFIIGRFSWKSNPLATKTGLLRVLAPWWIYSTLATEWLMQFGQIFGIPIRWAKYTNPSQRDAVAEMLANMGSSGWGAFPEGTTLEIHESSKAASDNPNAYMLERSDKLCDVVILGNTLTSDTGSGGGGNRALGEVHERVEQKRVVHAAKWAGECLTRGLSRAICELNYGDSTEVPSIEPVITEARDEKGDAERDKILFFDMNIPVSKEFLYNRHSIPMPQDGDDLYEKPEPPAPVMAPGAAPKAPGSARKPGQRSLAALDGLNVPENVIQALERMPDAVRDHYVSEIVQAQQPRYSGGQPGGGRWQTKAKADGIEKVKALMGQWPPEGQHRAARHMRAFGMEDSAGEFRQYLRPDLADVVQAEAGKVKKLTDVPIKELKTTQSTIDCEKVMGMLGSADNSGDLVHKSPIVVKKAGKSWLWDGHHRAAANLMQGKETLSARIINLE